MGTGVETTGPREPTGGGSEHLQTLLSQALASAQVFPAAI